MSQIYSYKGTDYEFPETMSDSDALYHIRIDKGEISDTGITPIPAETTRTVATAPQTLPFGDIAGYIGRSIASSVPLVAAARGVPQIPQTMQQTWETAKQIPAQAKTDIGNIMQPGITFPERAGTAVGGVARGVLGGINIPLTFVMEQLKASYPEIAETIGRSAQALYKTRPMISTGYLQPPTEGASLDEIKIALDDLKVKYPRAAQQIENVIDVASVATLGKIGGPPAQAGLRAAGTEVIKPKIKKYLGETKTVSAEQLGKYTKEQVDNMARIVAEEQLYPAIGNPEKMHKMAINRGNEYTNAAYKEAVGSTNKYGNPVFHVREKIMEQINNGKIGYETIPAGDIPVYKRQFEKLLADMIDRGYNKNLPADGLIDFKRDLGVKWTKGPLVQPLAETVKNTLRKEAYHTVNEMITDPNIKQYLDKATDIYRVADVVEGQKSEFLKDLLKKATIPGALTGTLATAATTTHFVPQLTLPAVAGGVVGAGILAARSPQVGRGLLTLGNLGRKTEIPVGMTPAQQDVLRRVKLQPEVEVTGPGEYTFPMDRPLGTATIGEMTPTIIRPELEKYWPRFKHDIEAVTERKVPESMKTSYYEFMDNSAQDMGIPIEKMTTPTIQKLRDMFTQRYMPANIGTENLPALAETLTKIDPSRWMTPIHSYYQNLQQILARETNMMIKADDIFAAQKSQLDDMLDARGVGKSMWEDYPPIHKYPPKEPPNEPPAGGVPAGSPVPPPVSPAPTLGNITN